MFRSILREKNTPGSGQSVRWGARDAYRTITPNTSAASGEDAMHSPLYEDEEGSSFRARMQDESSDDHGEKIDQLAAMGQSVGSRFAASGSTTPPTSGPSKLSTSTLPPIPVRVSDSSLPTRRASRPTRPSILPSDLTQDNETQFVSAADVSEGATDDLTEQARKCMNVTAGPSKSIRGMTTVYPPGMYNFTKSTVIPSNPIPSFSAEPEVDPGPKPKSRSKFIDPVGSSSLDFIIAPGASLSRTARARTSLPPQPLPPFDPPPVPTSSRPLSTSNLTLQPPASPRASFSRPEDESNLLARATTTKTFQISTRELPTFYPPGGYKFDPTQIDPDNIPELSRFFIPDTEGPDNSKLGPDASRAALRLLLDLDESNASTVSPSRVPLAVSKSVSRSRPNSLSSNSSFSGANPNSLADLTQLIESQYKADLAAHTALVPILLSRAETAEGSAQRLSCVVKDARTRVKELERLCGELGHEVGLLKKERSELIADRSNRRHVDRARFAAVEIGNLSTDLDTLAQAQTARGPGREGSQKESTEKGGEDEARARLAELESRLEDVEKSRVGWGQRRGVLETEVRDLEVRVEREKDGSGAKEAFALERQQWEKERMALLDRAVRAEQALDVAKDPDTAEADQKLRRQLEEYKAEVESQWKYAEQADATIKALEADVNRLNKELENARKAGRRSPQSDEGWKRKEAEWERQRAEWERAKAESQAGEQARQEDMQAEIDALKEDMDGLAYERDAYQAELNEAEMKRMEEDMAILADRAQHAEEKYISTQNELRTTQSKLVEQQDQIKVYENSNQGPKQLQGDLGDLRAERKNLENERNQLLENIELTEKQMRDLEARCVRAENDRAELVQDRAEIEDEMERMRVELEDARHERGSLEQKCDSLAQQLSSEQAARSSVAKEHQRVITRLEDLDREHQSSLDTIRRLERIVQARNTELAQTEESIRTQALEAEQLRSHRRELERIKVQRDDALQAESQLRKQLDDAQKLLDESTRTQRRVSELMTESADKEVRIVQLSKARAQDLEDKEGLNVALQSKQQELELIKRKLGVRGTAGATPAPSRMNKGSYSRRESTASSAALETPLPRAMIRKDYPDFAPSESTATASSYSVAATPLQTSSRANIYGTTAEVNITNPDTVKPGRRISDSIPLDHLCGLYP
ncbi:hypothetical protein RHS01_11444 [Rhizoctonia solani]|uniref:Uncharacterized protein n=1 Tax=Rhizoctonia solani TaxID=456999 RepID=A0A8H7I049_9AGAM|nr:hypothetical protein RHS01_11444 [Rhizoctonia solani]